MTWTEAVYAVLLSIITYNLWGVNRGIRRTRHMLYAMLSKIDGKPQPGDVIESADGRTAEVLNRSWDGIADVITVSYPDGGGIDRLETDTLTPVNLTARTTTRDIT